MDRYSRGYDDRYRGYYDRPRSDTYRPAENYRSERDYRDGGRNYSPNPHYSSSRSPGHNSSSGSRGDRYSYSDSRPYSSHYSSRGPSPSRSSSRSPRRPSYGYYRPYSGRRSPSPVSGRSRSSSRRRDSYDHRPYHGSPSYSQYPSSYRGSNGGGPYPPYSARRHYSGPSSYSPNYGPSTSGGYHSSSREPSAGPSPLHSQSQQPYSTQMQKSMQTTPSSTAPNSPRHQDTIVTSSSPTQQPTQTPQKPQTETTAPPLTSSPTHTTFSASTTVAAAAAATTTTTTATSTSTTTTTTTQQATSTSLNASSSYSQPPTSSSYPYSSSSSSSPYTGPGPSAPVRTHSGPPLHHHGSSSYHSPHYSTYHSVPAPVRQRVSWAPEQEKEVERYSTEQRKLCEEENKILINCRKSRFELELADWEVRKLDHQLELVQKQWEENGMEELVKEEMAASKFNNTAKLVSTGTSKLMIL